MFSDSGRTVIYRVPPIVRQVGGLDLCVLHNGVGIELLHQVLGSIPPIGNKPAPTPPLNHCLESSYLSLTLCLFKSEASLPYECPVIKVVVEISFLFRVQK